MSPRRFVALAALATLAQAAHAQTDDVTPFYAGGSLGVSHVSNVYRQATAPNSDTLTSAGLLGGINERLGRQHLTLDGSLQNNRYSTNSDLNYRSHSLRAALNWQTVANLSGVLSAKSSRSLADFNIGNGVAPIFKKNIEGNDEYQAVARLGVATRYTIESGWTHVRKTFTAEEYDRFAYTQNTGSLGLYATPAGNVKLGLVGRHAKGQNPRYPVGVTLDPDTLQPRIVSAVNDYTRDDLDFTTRWSIGGHSTLNTRISRSKTNNGINSLRDFSGTTGALGWSWQPTGKVQVDLRYSRDTGQESIVRAADLNRVYTSWQLSGTYALTGKLNLSASAASNRARRTSEDGDLGKALEGSKSYNVGLRWSIYRGFSLGCQYDHVDRDNSVPQYAFKASSYGCTGQAILY